MAAIGESGMAQSYNRPAMQAARATWMALAGVLVIGIGFGAWFWHGLLKRVRRADVPQHGQVVHGRIQKLTSFVRLEEEELCHLSATYEVDGVRYDHHCQIPAAAFGGLTVGDPIRLHYDPEDPFASVCAAEGEKGPKPMRWYDAVAASICPLLSIVFVAAAAIRLRRASMA
jgi:hypothetical protein